MVVFDCDDLSKVEQVLEQCGDTAHKLRTPHGIHLGYRKRMGTVLQNTVKVKGMDIDIRTDGGLEMIPNSPMRDGAYRWLGEGLHPISELPVARIGWTRERTRRRVQPTVEVSADDVMFWRARAYASHVEGAVSGQGGHNKTYRLACKLTHRPPLGFGLGLEQALVILREWSETSCEPPWSEEELRHKVMDAMKRR